MATRRPHVLPVPTQMYICYRDDIAMEVTISKLRQNLFQLVEKALSGEPVQFVHKGVVFEIKPETAPDRLSRLTRQTIVAPGGDIAEAGKELLKEMEAEWEQDWADL